MALLLLLMSGTSMASNLVPSFEGQVVSEVTVRHMPIKVYQVAELTAPNTSKGMEGFAIQLAYWLHDWTAAHDVEAIANLCHSPDGTQWGQGC